MDSIIVEYLSTQDCFYILQFVSVETIISSRSKHLPSVNEKLIRLADDVLKRRRLTDIKRLGELLETTELLSSPKILSNMNGMAVHNKYVNLCKKYKPLWDYNINAYMKSSIAVLNYPQEISAQSLVAISANKDIAKLFFRAVLKKKFLLLDMYSLESAPTLRPPY